jgi:hypothetical protein
MERNNEQGTGPRSLPGGVLIVVPRYHTTAKGIRFSKHIAVKDAFKQESSNHTILAHVVQIQISIGCGME